MLSTTHPDDERLSALAARDDDATADARLVAHVETCARCADLVAELGALRASLAELPDIAPSRPLRLLPAVEPERPATTDRLGGWVRRLFAPAMTAGAALAMVGLVGTAAPALIGTAAPALDGASGGADAGAALEHRAEDADPAAEDSAGGGESRILTATDDPSSRDGMATERAAEGTPEGQPDAYDFGDGDDRLATESLPAERSPWPMVLFTGVAVLIGAALLRWILVPRAG